MFIFDRFDCADKSDESFCPWACTFDANDLCGWVNEVKEGSNLQPKITWKLEKGSDPNIGSNSFIPQYGKLSIF
jgi:hypothetical protein